MRGGFRKNSGRKKGFAARNAEEARRFLAERVAEEIEPIAVALIKEAKKGNIAATKELLDRAWGKPIQSINLEKEPFHIDLAAIREKYR